MFRTRRRAGLEARTRCARPSRHLSFSIHQNRSLTPLALSSALTGSVSASRSVSSVAMNDPSEYLATGRGAWAADAPMVGWAREFPQLALRRYRLSRANQPPSRIEMSLQNRFPAIYRRFRPFIWRARVQSRRRINHLAVFAIFSPFKNGENGGNGAASKRRSDSRAGPAGRGLCPWRRRWRLRSRHRHGA